MKAPKRTRRAAPRTAADIRARALRDAAKLVRDLVGSYSSITILDAPPDLLEAVAALDGGERDVAVSDNETWDRSSVRDVGLSVCSTFRKIEVAS